MAKYAAPILFSPSIHPHPPRTNPSRLRRFSLLQTLASWQGDLQRGACAAMIPDRRGSEHLASAAVDVCAVHTLYGHAMTRYAVIDQNRLCWMSWLMMSVAQAQSLVRLIACKARHARRRSAMPQEQYTSLFMVFCCSNKCRERRLANGI